MYVYIYMYVCIYIYMYICIYAYMYSLKDLPEPFSNPFSSQKANVDQSPGSLEPLPGITIIIVSLSKTFSEHQKKPPAGVSASPPSAPWRRRSCIPRSPRDLRRRRAVSFKFFLRSSAAS